MNYKIMEMILHVLSKTFWIWFTIISIGIGFVGAALWLS